MPRVTFRLDEQFSDQRSNEIAYKFTVENQGVTPIAVHSITPRIPEGVDIVEVKDPSLEAVRAKHSRLCSELTQLLRDQLDILSESIREKRAQVFRERMDYLMKSTGTLMSSPFNLLFRWTIGKGLQGLIDMGVEEARTRYDALYLNIENKSHAESAFGRFLDTDTVDDGIKEVFRAKTEQIAELEEQMDKDVASSSLATIEPDSFFALTYVLKFPRRLLDPTKFKIDVEVSYAELGENERYVGGASTSVVISPRPAILTTIAIVFSLLGVVLKVAIEASALDSQLVFHVRALQALTNGSAVAAVIIAAVFFNVYEFTDIGKRIRMGVGWRSAMLIGCLSGLLEERILAAIKGFIGM